jgi:hypothetical protein
MDAMNLFGNPIITIVPIVSVVNARKGRVSDHALHFLCDLGRELEGSATRGAVDER